MRQYLIIFLSVCLLSLLTEKGIATPVADPTSEAVRSPSIEEPKPSAPAAGPGLLDARLDDAPTYIKSKSMTLKQGQQIFIYEGGVETRHGDMTITSETLEGTYNEKNEIEQLVALTNVVIIRSSGLRATSEKAVYDKKTRTVVLTENPELQQQGSILSADAITIFLDEDRSVADGEVRVKLVQKDQRNVGRFPG